MRAILDTPWQNRVTFVVQDNHSPAARKCLIHGREGYKLVSLPNYTPMALLLNFEP